MRGLRHFPHVASVRNVTQLVQPLTTPHVNRVLQLFEWDITLRLITLGVLVSRLNVIKEKKNKEKRKAAPAPTEFL